MNIHHELKQFGLNNSEIVVYLFLLEQGLSSPPHIARGTGISRTNCYHIFVSLKQKGLIDEQQIHKRKAYVATDPESLVRNLEKKKESVKRILPDLRGLYKTQKHKPTIKFFDGWEQIKQIYEQSLEAEEIFAIGSTQKLFEIDNAFFNRYIKNIQHKKIMFHDILEYESGRKNYLELKELFKGYYDASILPKEYKNIETDILFWQDTIALMTLSEPMFGTVLINKQLAHTFRVLFHVIKNGYMQPN